MEKIESLTNTLSQITMYDIKSMYNQAKNVVLNVSEMEAKVREATNDDPWGASSTLMQEIAQGTFSFQHFNEIMPCIYARFMEKEARQWRQIYKALQLLEYLIKHGSERVVDDARSHISTLKMLRNFHYIDDKGKDEGVNVRNRSRELVELLSDVEKIRAERRKAKNNKNKYIGVGNDGFSGGSFSSGGGRYGGFGNDSLGSAGGSYGNGGGDNYGSYGAGSSARGSSSFTDRRGVEEYDAGDDEIGSRSPVRSSSVRSQPVGSSRATPVRKATAPTPAPAPVEDLLGGFDDDTFGSSAPAPPTGGLATNKALPAVAPRVSLDDDDFADFQAAPVTAATPVQQPPAQVTKPNLMEMLNSAPARPTMPVTHTPYAQPQQQTAHGYGIGMGANSGLGSMGHRPSPSMSSSMGGFAQPMQPQPQQNMFGGGAPMRPMMGHTSTPSYSSSPSMQPAATAPKATTGATASFDDLWSLSLGTSSKPTTAGAAGGKSIKDLEKEKAMAGLWGGQKQGGGAAMGGGGAFGAFGGSSTSTASNSNNAGDDLLL